MVIHSQQKIRIMTVTEITVLYIIRELGGTKVVTTAT